MSQTELHEDDVKLIDQLKDTHVRLKQELGKVIEGQKEVIDRILISIFASGHSLLMGVPGLAKTLMIRSLAQTMDMEFNRIQFTPDMMPSDITGTDILQDGSDGRREFEFIKGPVFANIVLADEINRTSPKTQAALLEAMQERKVTVVGKTYDLPAPFFVLATQNPIEQEGTYPLPEAQLDRFMFFIEVEYPSEDEELAVIMNTTGDTRQSLQPVLNSEDLIKFQHLVLRMPVSLHVYKYALKLARYSRPSPNTPDWINKMIKWGAGPRVGQFLILGAKARAALDGRYMVSIADIDAISAEVLVHRLQLTFQAESEGLTPRAIVERIVEECRSGS